MNTSPDFDIDTDTPHLTAQAHAHGRATGGHGAGAPAANSAPSNHDEVEALLSSLDLSMAIGEDDYIEGTIKTGKGKSVVIRGTIKGELHCAGTVVILPSGKFFGKLVAASLTTMGEIGANDTPAILEVGNLHIGKGSRTVADCTYDTMSMDVPNRGVRGTLNPKDGKNG